MNPKPDTRPMKAVIFWVDDESAHEIARLFASTLLLNGYHNNGSTVITTETDMLTRFVTTKAKARSNQFLPNNERCASALAGTLCPDDLCRNASEQTQCGAYVDDMRGESEWDTPEQDETWDFE
jgi:hypothetical protein